MDDDIKDKQEDYEISSAAGGKAIRKVSPLGYRVLVRIEKGGDRTDGGLYLPEGAKNSMSESLVARVVEVASARDYESDDDTNISGIPRNATVLIPKNAGVCVPWDDHLRIVESKEILALVNEIAIV